MSFFMLLGILLFVLGKTRKYCLILSGISIGLAMLTKYPGVLSLFIIFSFVVLMDRALLKQKSFWLLGALSFIVFCPWLIWNWNVYGNLNDMFVSAHALNYHGQSAARILSEHKVFLLSVFANANASVIRLSRWQALVMI